MFFYIHMFGGLECLSPYVKFVEQSVCVTSSSARTVRNKHLRPYPLLLINFISIIGGRVYESTPLALMAIYILLSLMNFAVFLFEIFAWVQAKCQSFYYCCMSSQIGVVVSAGSQWLFSVTFCNLLWERLLRKTVCSFFSYLV